MREIKLTKGFVALVDDSDYERVVAEGTWYAFVHRRTVYAARRPQSGMILLHRFIMGVTERTTQVDHEDYNGLNNQRYNLRVCDNQKNHFGMRKMRRKGSSQYKGVNWFPRDSKWHAHIKRNQKTIHIGYFTDEREAALAYDAKARELFGEFCHCNFPLA